MGGGYVGMTMSEIMNSVQYADIRVSVQHTFAAKEA